MPFGIVLSPKSFYGRLRSVRFSLSSFRALAFRSCCFSFSRSSKDSLPLLGLSFFSGSIHRLCEALSLKSPSAPRRTQLRQVPQVPFAVSRRIPVPSRSSHLPPFSVSSEKASFLSFSFSFVFIYETQSRQAAPDNPAFDFFVTFFRRNQSFSMRFVLMSPTYTRRKSINSFTMSSILVLHCSSFGAILLSILICGFAFM